MIDKSGQTSRNEMIDTGVQTSRDIVNLENQLKIVSSAWMESETTRKQAIFDVIKILHYFNFKTDEIMYHYEREDFDKVRELGQEAIDEMKDILAKKNIPIEVRDQGTSPLYINHQDSEPKGKGRDQGTRPLYINPQNSAPKGKGKSKGKLREGGVGKKSGARNRPLDITGIPSTSKVKKGRNLLRVNTNVAFNSKGQRVRGLQVHISNIEKKMDDFIPQRRSNRLG